MGRIQIALAVAVLATACTDGRPVAVDGAAAGDGPAADRAAASPDLLPHDTRPVDLGPDTCPWPPDLGIDVLPWHSLLYFMGKHISSVSAWRITTYGSCQGRVPELPSTFSLAQVKVNGQPSILAHRSYWSPVPLTAYDALRPVQLPGNLGLLYHFADKVSKKKAGGFFVVRPDGSVRVLARAPTGGSSSAYHLEVGLNPAGSLLAAVKRWTSSSDPAGVHLIRTDGRVFSHGASICDVTPASSKGSFLPASLFFTRKHLHFITDDMASGSALYRAPIDCSGKAARVPLPKVAGALPRHIAPAMGTSRDGGKLLLLAGSTSTKVDIQVLDDATGKVTNLTRAPAEYAPPGTFWPHDFWNVHAHHDRYAPGGAALSPSGKAAAYVRSAGGVSELFVRSLAAGSKAAHATGTANLTSAIKYVQGLRWTSDDDLYFWGSLGVASNHLYRFRPSTGKVACATCTSGAKRPFDGADELRPIAGWFSPNRKYYYVINYDAAGVNMGLLSVDLISARGAWLYSGMYTLKVARARTGDRAFFTAFSNSTRRDDQLYVFHQNSPTKPVRLTSFKPKLPYPANLTESIAITGIHPNRDGSLVLVNVGYPVFGVGTPQFGLYMISATGAFTPRRLTNLTLYGNLGALFTRDDRLVIYGPGANDQLKGLVVQPVAGGSPRNLAHASGFATPIVTWR